MIIGSTSSEATLIVRDRHLPFPSVATDDDVDEMLARGCVVAVGVSGGKDSVACALAVHDHLELIGYSGPRVLIHADLGVVEWKDSLAACERLAERIGWELIVCRRRAGDMMDRWESRWEANVERYNLLSTVRIILPWSTPSMRFCTSELKVEVITAELKRRFPGRDILNVVGIRREESTSRAKKPVSSPELKLQRGANTGRNWNAIIDWKLDDVFSRIAAGGLTLHEAYTVYGASRVSCCFCIMSSAPDLAAAASAPDNHDIYRRMVALEARSTFGFQGSRWLADVAPGLLDAGMRAAVAQAKENSRLRQVAEARIPSHLLYTKGWPTCLPSRDEAELLASVRREVSTLLKLPATRLSAHDVIERYSELLELKEHRDEAAGVSPGAAGGPSALPPRSAKANQMMFSFV
jgi:3'-phosphoadenosine 5'-phosphosulfate sulfotransferase (PAPS reductase)/FAD synthetase